MLRIRTAGRHVALVASIAVVVGCALGAPGGAAAGAVPASGYVRVNQAGYPGGGPKRAYLLAPAAEPGGTFVVVRDGGGVALRGRLGPDLGAWSGRFPHVYAIDFSRIRRRGVYRVQAAGATPAPFRIASGAALAARPIRNALAFYQDERDGPDFIRTALRSAPGHLNDAHAMTYLTPKVDGDGNFRNDLHPLGIRIDAAGGWWDAGDYLKFVETTSYTGGSGPGRPLHPPPSRLPGGAARRPSARTWQGATRPRLRSAPRSRSSGTPTHAWPPAAFAPVSTSSPSQTRIRAAC